MSSKTRTEHTSKLVMSTGYPFSVHINHTVKCGYLVEVNICKSKKVIDCRCKGNMTSFLVGLLKGYETVCLQMVILTKTKIQFVLTSVFFSNFKIICMHIFSLSVSGRWAACPGCGVAPVPTALLS